MKYQKMRAALAIATLRDIGVDHHPPGRNLAPAVTARSPRRTAKTARSDRIVSVGVFTSAGDEIEEWIEKDPHAVDEVPIEAHHGDGCVRHGGEAALVI
jgi:hypothetical protein